jgi:hypothetical protein
VLDDFAFILLKVRHDLKNIFFSKFMGGDQQVPAAGWPVAQQSPLD